VSGVTLDRPGLQQLIADCCAGKISMFITKDPERLSRN
jgi:DNA invertase Pin-like site-specific DNA recombinase